MPTCPTSHYTWSLTVAAAILASPLTASNTLGPDWDGDSKEDAGNKPETAQKVKLDSTQVVVRISGKLKGEEEEGGLAGGGLGDYQDMYAVVITDPGEFVIHTLPPLGGAEFNTILSVYDYSGQALLANDDVDQGESGSLIGSCTTDGQFCITDPGLVYIAISGFDSRPLTSLGEDVFAWNQDPTAVVGPSGAGVIDDWSGPGETGDYVIMLESVGPIPPECGAENTSSCFQVHPLPYCSTPGCCEAVCSVDPFCCEVTWDLFCVNEANLFCGGEESFLHCGSKEAESCQIPHESPFCADPACCAFVCSSQPECCLVMWDEMCVTFAQKFCSEPCNENCPPDFNFDLAVTGADLAILLGNWTQPGCTDLNGNGVTDGADITILLAEWGDGCLD